MLSRARTLLQVMLLHTCALSLFAANPLQSTLADFESGSTEGAVPVTAANSSSMGDSNSTLVNVTESGSKRLRMTDDDGVYNGAAITFTNAIPGPGYYLITADVKVDNPGGMGSFGMALREGAAASGKIMDETAGYVMNLSGTGGSALGYQTIGAAIEVASGGSFPRSLTVYFSTDPSGNNYTASAYEGNFSGNHRAGTTTWAAGTSNAVYVDNIRRIGPGNFGEERHLWISLGDGYTDLNKLENILVQAKANNFNCIDILTRYRSDAYYVPNRSDSTYPNPEPFGTKVGGKAASADNDPLQYSIDRGHELGLKVYAAFSCFLVSNSTYPSTLPSGSIMWYYNSGSPRAMLGSDPSAEGLWADYARADVRTYTRNVLMDMVRNYDIDGVVFDRIRTPSTNFSYNPQGLAEMGVSGMPLPTDTTFRNLRRDALTTFLQESYEAVTNEKPWVVVGSAPIAYGSALTDTYNSVLQFWPKWSSRPTANRAISFGVMDLYQPQFYRLTSSGGSAANRTLMLKSQYGDISAFSLDMGLMPGAMTAVSPLLYHPTSGDTIQSGVNAQNITDARELAMNGFGIYPATQTLADIAAIRAPGASSAGTDVLGSPAPFTDYLMKANYDNVKPNAVGSFSATPRADGTVLLSWNAPAAATDGETADGYVLYRSKTSPVKEYRANQITLNVISGGVTSYVVPTDFAGAYYYKIVPLDDYNNRGPASTSGPITVAGEPAPPADVVVDNPAATFTGSWSVASSSTDKYGADYCYKFNGDGSNTASFAGTLPTAGTWEVSEWHPVGTNRATNAHHVVSHESGTTSYNVNQTVNGGQWNALGSHQFSAGAASVTIDDLFSGSVIMADAIRFGYVVMPPVAPSSLTASPVGQTAIDLAWSDNASNERHFIVSRASSAAGPFVDLVVLGINVTSYRDNGLSADTTYYYKVRATNSGGDSGYSNTASTTTQPVPPTAPSGLAATAVSTSQINLVWTDNASNETNMVVARGTASGGPYSDIATLAANTTSYANTDLSANTTYYYVVRAVNTGGASANSAQASAKTQAGVPAAPSGLSATAVSASQINLVWTDNASNETNIVVARGTASGGPYSDIVTLGANTTSYANTTGLSANTTYYYVVRALNAGGSSANSAQASAITWPAEIIVDNTAAGFTASATWYTATSAADKYGTNYRYRNTAAASDAATWNYTVPQTRQYEIYAWWSVGSNRSKTAPYVVAHAGGSTTINKNQQATGGSWQSLGVYTLNAGANNVKLSCWTTVGYVVIADAVRIVPR